MLWFLCFINFICSVPFRFFVCLLFCFVSFRVGVWVLLFLTTDYFEILMFSYQKYLNV